MATNLPNGNLGTSGSPYVVNNSFSIITGGNGNDFLTFNGSFDIITIGNGNDTINLAGSFDILTFGSGMDILNVSGSYDLLVSHGTLSTDKVVLTGNYDLIDLLNGTDSVTGSGSNEVVALGNGNDFVDLSGSGEAIGVGNGNDVILVTGASGSNSVTTGNGNDYIDVAGPKSSVYGGSGNDTIVYHAGDKALDGGGKFTTLLLNTTVGTIDLTASNSPVMDIQFIDLTNGKTNIAGFGTTIDLNVATVNALDGSVVNPINGKADTLVVLAGYNDVVNIGTGWTNVTSSVPSLNTVNELLINGSDTQVLTPVTLTNYQVYTETYHNVTNTLIVDTTGIGVLSFSQSPLNFGPEDLLTNTTVSETIKNVGTAPLIITGVSSLLGTEFSDSGFSAPLNLSPGQSATIGITFTPTTVGFESATLTFTDNGSPSTQSLILEGTGFPSLFTTGSDNVTFSFNGTNIEATNSTYTTPELLSFFYTGTTNNTLGGSDSVSFDSGATGYSLTIPTSSPGTDTFTFYIGATGNTINNNSSGNTLEVTDQTGGNTFNIGGTGDFIDTDNVSLLVYGTHPTQSNDTVNPGDTVNVYGDSNTNSSSYVNTITINSTPQIHFYNLTDTINILTSGSTTNIIDNAGGNIVNFGSGGNSVDSDNVNLTVANQVGGSGDTVNVYGASTANEANTITINDGTIGNPGVSNLSDTINIVTSGSTTNIIDNVGGNNIDLDGSTGSTVTLTNTGASDSATFGETGNTLNLGSSTSANIIDLYGGNTISLSSGDTVYLGSTSTNADTFVLPAMWTSTDVVHGLFDATPMPLYLSDNVLNLENYNTDALAYYAVNQTTINYLDTPVVFHTDGSNGLELTLHAIPGLSTGGSIDFTDITYQPDYILYDSPGNNLSDVNVVWDPYVFDYKITNTTQQSLAPGNTSILDTITLEDMPDATLGTLGSVLGFTISGGEYEFTLTNPNGSIGEFGNAVLTSPTPGSGAPSEPYETVTFDVEASGSTTPTAYQAFLFDGTSGVGNPGDANLLYGLNENNQTIAGDVISSSAVSPITNLTYLSNYINITDTMTDSNTLVGNIYDSQNDGIDLSNPLSITFSSNILMEGAGTDGLIGNIDSGNYGIYSTNDGTFTFGSNTLIAGDGSKGGLFGNISSGNDGIDATNGGTFTFGSNTLTAGEGSGVYMAGNINSVGDGIYSTNGGTFTFGSNVITAEDGSYDALIGNMDTDAAGINSSSGTFSFGSNTLSVGGGTAAFLVGNIAVSGDGIYSTGDAYTFGSNTLTAGGGVGDYLVGNIDSDTGIQSTGGTFTFGSNTLSSPVDGGSDYLVGNIYSFDIGIQSTGGTFTFGSNTLTTGGGVGDYLVGNIYSSDIGIQSTGGTFTFGSNTLSAGGGENDTLVGNIYAPVSYGIIANGGSYNFGSNTLTVTGTGSGDNLVGNIYVLSPNQAIFSSSGSTSFTFAGNTLIAGTDTETLTGHFTNYSYTGSEATFSFNGGDTFVFNAQALGTDTITDFNVGMLNSQMMMDTLTFTNVSNPSTFTNSITVSADSTGGIILNIPGGGSIDLEDYNIGGGLFGGVGYNGNSLTDYNVASTSTASSVSFTISDPENVFDYNTQSGYANSATISSPSQDIYIVNAPNTTAATIGSAFDFSSPTAFTLVDQSDGQTFGHLTLTGASTFTVDVSPITGPSASFNVEVFDNASGSGNPDDSNLLFGFGGSDNIAGDVKSTTTLAPTGDLTYQSNFISIPTDTSGEFNTLVGNIYNNTNSAIALEDATPPQTITFSSNTINAGGGNDTLVGNIDDGGSNSTNAGIYILNSNEHTFYFNENTLTAGNGNSDILVGNIYTQGYGIYDTNNLSDVFNFSSNTLTAGNGNNDMLVGNIFGKLNASIYSDTNSQAPTFIFAGNEINVGSGNDDTLTGHVDFVQVEGTLNPIFNFNGGDTFVFNLNLNPTTAVTDTITDFNVGYNYNNANATDMIVLNGITSTNQVTFSTPGLNSIDVNVFNAAHTQQIATIDLLYHSLGGGLQGGEAFNSFSPTLTTVGNSLHIVIV